MSDWLHTPPPWTLERIPNYQGFSHLVGGRIVCEAYAIAEISGAIEVDGQPHPIHLGNANLMTAAPDLRRALEAVIPDLLRLAELTPGGGERGALWARIAAVRDALAAGQHP